MICCYAYAYAYEAQYIWFSLLNLYFMLMYKEIHIFNSHSLMTLIICKHP